MQGRVWSGAAAMGIVVLAAACGGSDSKAHLDKSLEKRVRTAFAQAENANGARMSIAIAIDQGDGSPRNRCLVFSTEPKQVAPRGRVKIDYFGSTPSISEDGVCTSTDGETSAVIDGSTAYLPSENSYGDTDCDVTYRRAKLSSTALTEVKDYGNKTGTSKVSQLLSAANKLTARGKNQIDVDLDPERAADSLGSDSDGSLPDDASATMSIMFHNRTLARIDVEVGVEDISIEMNVLYSGLGSPQHIAVPTGSCVVAGSETLDSVSEVIDALDVS